MKKGEECYGLRERAYYEWLSGFYTLRITDRYKKVLDIFSKYKLDRVLDIGCGGGDFSILYEMYMKICGYCYQTIGY